MSDEADPRQEAANRRLLTDVGIGVGVLLGMVALHFTLFAPEPWVAAGMLPRALLSLGIGLALLTVSGQVLYRYEEAAGALPIARTVTAMASFYSLGRAVWDGSAAVGLPLYPWGLLLLGVLGLAMSTWAESSLLAVAGAEMVDQVAATRVAAFFGFAGGFGTSAVFFHLGLSLVEIPLGWVLARRYRRALGLGLMSNGGYTLLIALLVLGTHGPELHGVPSWSWVSHVYFALAILVSIAMARVTAALGGGGIFDLASRMILLTVSYVLRWYGVPDNLSFLGAMMIYWALQSSGLLQAEDPDRPRIALTPELIQNPEMLQELLEEHRAASEIMGRMSAARQERHVGATLSLAAGLVLLFLGAGASNRLVGVREAFRLPVSTRSLESPLRVAFEEVHYPEELPRGAPLDCYLVPADAEGRLLVFWELHAVRRGDPVPEGVDPERAWTLPARLFRVRTAEGRLRAGPLLFHPLHFDLSEEQEASIGKGDTLVFARGWTGYAFLQEVIPAEPGEDPIPGADDDEDEDRGWLGRSRSESR